MKTRYFLGIDIGKNSFHAALTIEGQNFYDQEVNNNTAAIKKYFQELKTKFGSNQINLLFAWSILASIVTLYLTISPNKGLRYA